MVRFNFKAHRVQVKELADRPVTCQSRQANDKVGSVNSGARAKLKAQGPVGSSLTIGP